MMTPLNLCDPAEIAVFERACYEAFAALPPSPLLRELWEWDDTQKRLRTRVAYRDQTVFVERNSRGDIRHALAVAAQLPRPQAAFYGFDVPLSPECCEALVTFSYGERQLHETRKFWRDCRVALHEQGFRRIYATCTPRALPFYDWLGAAVTATHEVGGETRHFFYIPLNANGRRGFDLLA